MKYQSTSRFSKTIDYYDRFRPGYPKELIAFLQKEIKLKPSHVIADIGSGTGKLSSLFLERKNKVYAVEPNQDMRDFAERNFSQDENFISIDGTAEATQLPDHSVDFITVAQAFHWFNYSKFRMECQRILKPGGWVLLIWNKRVDEKSSFMKSYNEFLNQFATDYQKVNLRYVDHEIFKSFYGHSDYKLYTIEHSQSFDRKGLDGRYLSCSYAYDSTHSQHEEAMSTLRQIFDQFNVEERVNMWYRMELYYGQII